MMITFIFRKQECQDQTTLLLMLVKQYLMKSLESMKHRLKISRYSCRYKVLYIVGRRVYKNFIWAETHLPQYMGLLGCGFQSVKFKQKIKINFSETCFQIVKTHFKKKLIAIMSIIAMGTSLIFVVLGIYLLSQGSIWWKVAKTLWNSYIHERGCG